PGRLGVTADGQAIPCADMSGAVVLHRGPPHPLLLRLGPQDDVRDIALSPDRRWVATGSHGGPGAKVWDARTGELVKDLPVGKMCHVAFSPDGKWLATGGGGGRLWKVDSWEAGPIIGGLSRFAF